MQPGSLWEGQWGQRELSGAVEADVQRGQAFTLGRHDGGFSKDRGAEWCSEAQPWDDGAELVPVGKGDSLGENVWLTGNQVKKDMTP